MKIFEQKRLFPVSIFALAALAFVGCGGGSSSGGTPLAGQSVVAGSSNTTAPATPSAPATPVVQPSATVTLNPIVLVHGVGGPRSLLNPVKNNRDIADFSGANAHLQGLGFEVLTGRTSAYNSIHTRATQLKDQIETAYPDPSQKVNLVAHSMGGLDCRYMIAQLGMGPRVASLTTVSTPHRGTPVSDVALGLLPAPLQSLFDQILNLFSWDWDFVRDTSEDHIQNVFNPSTPDDPSVFYQSFGGVGDPLGQSGAKVSTAFMAPWAIVRWYSGPNDGLIPLTSSRWGTWRGELLADHAEQVGFSNGGASTNNFDHLSFFQDMVTDLAMRGY